MMMKKIFSSLLLAVIATPWLRALGPGDQAPKLTIAQWQHGPEITLQPPPPSPEPETIPYYRVVVIWGSWTPAAAASVDLLNRLKEKYPQREIVALARKGGQGLQNELAKGPAPRFSIAVDKEDKTVMAYMPGENIFPKAFIIAADRNILWAGEVIDLPGAVARIATGKYRPDQAKKLYRYHLALTTALQSGNISRIIRAGNDILDEDPGDGFALRTLMFIYESNGRQDEAVAVLTRLIARNPNLSQLHFLKLELLLRGTDPTGKEVRRELEATYRQFKKDSAVLTALTWFMLDRLPFRMTPVPLLSQCANAAWQNLPDGAPAAERASCLAAMARVEFFLGRTDIAITTQKQALALMPERDRAAARATLQVMTDADREPAVKNGVSVRNDALPATEENSGK
ncbi:MAG: hypothetical protein PHQ27_01440 [Victivallales bacterium]|nr:hypothetical protein [Victivallales bacterium]